MMLAESCSLTVFTKDRTGRKPAAGNGEKEYRGKEGMSGVYEKRSQ